MDAVTSTSTLPSYLSADQLGPWSVYEWVQDISSFFWSEDEINSRLDRLMAEAFQSIWEVAGRFKVTMRTAAFIVACERILQARQLRGLYP